MREVRRADQRYPGGDRAAGIRTWHGFSFSGYYDPDNTGFGLLVACNEEQLEPGAGFAEHPHRDLEIVTWVLTGELTHEDSTGQATVIRPGDVQRLSAGSGVRHSERNEGTEPLTFLQMWLVPAVFGAEPAYEVVRGIADGTPYALPGTDAVLHVRRLADGERTEVPQAPWVHVSVTRGRVCVDGETLDSGDALRTTSPDGLALAAHGPAECLIWEMHAEPRYG
ncbi:pirin family protein [Streptomyces sp. 549]|uniref:pirin family protein n=1 Tax=Streptomyces sp. 549 TaxID=3049076 RepID=UPI0024C249EA|nr:pirin-like bicupin family protein [Streptomyces sp. 549]MDK1473961.1 pirin family protein [Streptomyces sp. 549]